MDEPWLDSLSEDWRSEPPSSPSSGVDFSNSNGSRKVSSTSVQSRIPHLAANIRSSNNSGSFLKPRSSRGIARLNQQHALVERSASSLNTDNKSSPRESKRNPSSAIPRRASSAFSESQTSVQHHTIDKNSQLQETPEWKRRLREGNNADSDGVDLFSPSKLEGMFRQSSYMADAVNDENDESELMQSKPWSTIESGDFPLPATTTGSRRISKSRYLGMNTLNKIVEEGGTPELPSLDHARPPHRRYPASTASSSIKSARNAATTSQSRTTSLARSNDPRMRTISGRQEIENEVFSPIEDAEKSSLRKQALQDTLDSLPTSTARRADLNYSSRPQSSSSDRDVSYDANVSKDQNHSLVADPPNADLTSLSLPEDLSMGTQNYAGDSILLAGRRQTSIRYGRTVPKERDFRSSPPPYSHDLVESSRISNSEPPSPNDDSVVHHLPTSAQHSNAASPLKLFGARDTYTNNKLMRVLSQYEDEDSTPPAANQSEPLRMSNFGRGELDGFGFHKEVDRPHIQQTLAPEDAEKLFKDLIPLNMAQEREDGRNNISHSNERSPKRRRTLLKDEIFVAGAEVEVKISHLPEGNLAGKKRRDALPGKDAEQASPETLASRSILHPSGSRKSSGHRRTTSASDALQSATGSIASLPEKLAAELQSFAENVADIKQDSRKASLATKDYMEEANKVMEFIRARGKPKPPVPELPEPQDLSELGPDAILDLELDDSTKDSFSRPPSREGRPVPRPDRRHAEHDPATADHLKKYHESDDLELLASTSALGTWQASDNKAVEQAALIPVPDDDVDDVDQSIQSDPPGIRILNETDKKRKHSSSDAEPPSQGSQAALSIASAPTIATNSSTASGQKGTIGLGTVEIPETIGTMKYDPEKKVWVKQKLKPSSIPAPVVSPASKSARQEHSEVDPFDGIPDLSFDELKEASWKKPPVHGQAFDDLDQILETSPVQQEASSNMPDKALPKSSMKSPASKNVSTGPREQDRNKSEDAEHEIRLHQGLPSTDLAKGNKQQPRVVTISFSSPIASEIPYVPPPSLTDDLDDDDPSMLPLDDEGSTLSSSPARPDLFDINTPRSKPVMGNLERHEQYRAMTLNHRPISRIDEHDEEEGGVRELSLIHIARDELTPMPQRHVSLTASIAKGEQSLLCLTPLSEFTVHQIDKVNHPEESFVDKRANPKALRQAHGAAALIEDALVKAITDAEPTELFWEQLRRLSLPKSGLGVLHGLSEYCMGLDSLDVSGNRISQLNGVPPSLRVIDISSNLVNDLTSWTQLHNLQTINVSNNKLESLECFASLMHLRHLNASNNQIRNIEGVLDLDCLVTLDLSGNDIPEVDFQGAEMSCLEKLDVSKNNMVHVRNLDCLPQLKFIDMSENLLEELVINKDRVVQRLETLCLGENELKVLDLTAFPNLQRLNVDGNLLTSLHGLSEAEGLSILSAREQRVPSDLVNFILTTQHDCTELYLSSNALPETGLVVPDAPNFTLRCLELAACGIQEIPEGFGDCFPNMRVLNLNFNAISDLSPVQGMAKLLHIYLAKNRIKKMRRTCLTLARLATLRKVDLRDNPLTVGFYSPGHHDGLEALNRLPGTDPDHDQKWLGLIDETTWMRRRAMELLMADCCRSLEELDGLSLDRARLAKERATWDRLMGKGVFKKADLVIEAVPDQTA